MMISENAANMQDSISIQSTKTLLKNPKPPEVPFYEVPRTSKTSAEIISEARASIRPVSTRRPFTPREEDRRLFGKNSTHVQRPPSSFSLGKLHYESGDSRPISAALRLEPIEHHIDKKLCSTSDSNVSAVYKNHSDSSRFRLPSIPNDKKFCLENYFSLVLPDGITAETLRRRRRSQPVTTKTALEFPFGERTGDEKVNKHSDERRYEVDILNSNHSNAKENDNEILSDADYKSKILPLLDEMIREDGTPDKVELSKYIKQLYDNLELANILGKNFSQRASILKVLYKMLDSMDHNIQLQLARLILAMKVKGNNLTNLCKLIFKITRNENNDQLFLEDNLIDLFLQSISRMNPQHDSEALVYSIGALKFLSMNSTLLRELSNLCSIEILAKLVTAINVLKIENSKIPPQTGHVLFQVTGCLRNLAEGSANRQIFISSGVIIQLCISLELFLDDFDIITNIARILSKLTIHSDVCTVVSYQHSCFCAMVTILQQHEKRQELVVRIGFILGNLTAKSDEARMLLFSQTLCFETLLTLIKQYLPKDLVNKLKERDEDMENDVTIITDENKNTTIADDEDVVVKTIRVIANMSIHSDVGPIIASSDECLNLVLLILNGKINYEFGEELILSTLATLNNLSFYSFEKGAIAARQLEITECLVKILLKENTNELIEVIRVFGNLTRAYEVRELLTKKKVLHMMITLLDSGNKDIVFTSCGVLINFMADEDKRVILRNEGGVRKLIDVLKDFGTSDWQLASMVCQSLWNYTTKISFASKILEDGEIMELVNILEEYLNESVAMEASCHDKMDDLTHETIHDKWTYTFCPVAENLLKRVEKHFISRQIK